MYISVNDISPVELSNKLRSGAKFALLDVREPEEFVVARVEGAQLLPLSRLSEWQHRLDPNEDYVVMCHHGVRSAWVCQLLKNQGFPRVSNLNGGIERWSVEVDPNVPRY